MEEDYFIRTKVDAYFKEFLSISKLKSIELQNENSQEYVISHTHYSRVKDMSRKVAKYFMDTTENTNQKTNAILNNSKGNLKRFTTLLLKRNIRNLILFTSKK
jgi:hypothetical protein